MFSLLHIDNNFFYKKILHDLPIERDFQYFSAKTPELAYDILKTHDIDIIITGLEFENESEKEFISKLMEVKQTTTPVVVISAVFDAAMKSKLFEIGVTDFFTKDKFVEFLLGLIIKLKKDDFIALQLKSLSIAILDDNEIHLKTMKDMLEKNGITNVNYYLNPNDLLNSNQSYNIYMIDYVLQGISGDEVIAEIRKKDEYAVIIGISSIKSHMVISTILQSGADDFINKPFSEDLFMARIKAGVRTYFLMEQLKEKDKNLSQLLKMDVLTGFYNRKFTMEILENEIGKSQRYGTPLSILMFDIDHFKLVNESYGHNVGDIVLSKLGLELRNDSRKIDITGKYGDDEFIVILPDTNLTGARIYADRLRLDIEAMQFGDEDISITISGGLARYNDETIVELVKKADKFLCNAKQNGRNRIEFK